MVATTIAATLISISAYGATPENLNYDEAIEAAAGDEVPAVSSTPKFSGYTITNFLYQQDEGSSFNLRHMTLGLAGDLGSNFDYKIQLAFAGTPKIQDAYGRLKFNDAINVQIGQFKVPFSLENPLSPTSLEAFENSMIVSSLCGGRDIGVALYGSLGDNKIVEYSVGVFNGSGTNKADKDKYKDYIGRLIFNTPVEGLVLSGSFHFGNEDDAGKHIAYNRYAAGLKYDSDGLFARSEYLWGSDNLINTDGAYALLGYKINPRVKAFAKYDWEHHKIKDGNISAEANSVTAGVAYYLNSKVFFRLQYEMVQPDVQVSDKILNNVGAAVTIQF